jgi:hypothetical protein
VQYYWVVFVDLIATPFRHVPLIWGIVPLYFGLLLSELTSTKANFRTAIQTGFSFLWAGTQWLYASLTAGGPGFDQAKVHGTIPLNLVVTCLVLVVGLVALLSGLLKRFPQHCRFLGHTRFANYFAITLFPIQAHYMAWTWDRLAAIAIFALPVWLFLHFGLMPIKR